MNLDFFNQVIRNMQLSHRLLDAYFPDEYRADKDEILSIDDGLTGSVRETGVVFQSPDYDMRIQEQVQRFFLSLGMMGAL